MKIPGVKRGVKRNAAFSSGQAHAIYLAMLDAIDVSGNYPYFRKDVIEECGKAFERFLEKHCLPVKAAKKKATE